MRVVALVLALVVSLAANVYTLWPSRSKNPYAAQACMEAWAEENINSDWDVRADGERLLGFASTRQRAAAWDACH